MSLFGEPNVHSLALKKDINGLIKALNYQKNEIVRRAAAKALGEIGDPRAVTSLITSLGDESKAVQVESIISLARIEEAIVSVNNFLKQTDSNSNNKIHQKNAVDAWLKSADSGIIESLIFNLRYESEDVSKPIANVICEFGDKAVKTLIEIIADSQVNQLIKGSQNTTKKLIRIEEKATEILIRMGDKAVEPLVLQMGNFNKISIHHAASGVLLKMGDVAIQPLILALGSDNSDIHMSAAKVLQEIGESAVASLTTALEKSEHDGIRKRAGFVLKHIENNKKKNWDATDAESSFNKLMEELIQIGITVKNPADSSSGFLYLNNKRETQNNARAREIGEVFNEHGGIEMMRRAREIVREKLGKIPARELDFCWAYIGLWAP